MDVTGVNYKSPEDKWYHYKGVKPPERQSHGVSEDNIEDIIASTNTHNHKWLQQGNYIKCNAGKNEHGINIGVNRILKGTNPDGTPILEDM